MNTITFNEYNCVLRFPQYANGGKAIQLLGAGDQYMDEPIATASTWIPGLASDEIAIKNYSENEGILEALVAGGIVCEPHRYLNGFPIVRLLV